MPYNAMFWYLKCLKKHLGTHLHLHDPRPITRYKNAEIHVFLDFGTFLPKRGTSAAQALGDQKNMGDVKFYILATARKKNFGKQTNRKKVTTL